MRSVVRWIVAVVAALVIVGLIAYARGTAHHRGNEVGSSAEARGLHARTLS